jgi:hypothetical protein
VGLALIPDDAAQGVGRRDGVGAGRPTPFAALVPPNADPSRTNSSRDPATR